MVALLLKKLGPTFMSKLKGTFAFAICDAQTGRVLAACDRHATHSLWQAHLQVSNTTWLFLACTCVEKMQAHQGQCL